MAKQSVCAICLLHRIMEHAYTLNVIAGFSRGATWVNFCWVCTAGISEPLPHKRVFLVYFVAKDRPHIILVTFGQMIFLISKS